MKKAVYSADFETTTRPDDCRVWVWGLVSVDNPTELIWDKDIESFCNYVSWLDAQIYFHNLKFDGHFIIDYLLRQGYEHVRTKANEKPYKHQFTTLISDMNKMFQIIVTWDTGNTTEFRDSLKKLPMSVARIAKSFKLETTKGDIDYHAHRPVGYEPTEEELDYLSRDVEIVALALQDTLESGMTRLTVASDSMAEYKRLMGDKWFNRTFPILSDEMDSEIRRAYRGGFTYAAERYQGQLLGSGLVLDVNSLYPFVMHDRILPYGEPVYSVEHPEPTAHRPLTVFSITFTAKLREGFTPCIQVKGSALFGATEYLKVIKEPVTLMMTNIDLALYQEHYHMNIIAYGGGWSFKAATGMFDAYIDKWSAIKASETGGKREIAKLHLNGLYGKFGTNPKVTGKIPILENDRVKYVRGPDETRPPIYTAVAVFVTSWARDLTIRAAQANYDTFAYADTDSLHLLRDTVPDAIEVHPTKLGAWKHEYDFSQAFFIRAKAYLERKHDGTYKAAFAGVPERVSSLLTFDDLVDGKVIHGKLAPKSVPGGVVLEDVDFTIKM